MLIFFVVHVDGSLVSDIEGRESNLVDSFVGQVHHFIDVESSYKEQIHEHFSIKFLFLLKAKTAIHIYKYQNLHMHSFFHAFLSRVIGNEHFAFAENKAQLLLHS